MLNPEVNSPISPELFSVISILRSPLPIDRVACVRRRIGDEICSASMVLKTVRSINAAANIPNKNISSSISDNGKSTLLNIVFAFINTGKP